MSIGYWRGPYGICVSNEFEHIVAADGFNIHYKDGSVTQLARADGGRMSQQEYFAHHTVVIDGVRWYQGTPRQKADVSMDTD